MSNIIGDTLYYGGDIIVAKLKSGNEVIPILVEHTTKTGNDNSVWFALIICATIVVVTLIIALSLMLSLKKKYQNQALKKKYQKQVLRQIKRQKNKDKYIDKLEAYIEELDS